MSEDELRTVNYTQVNVQNNTDDEHDDDDGFVFTDRLQDPLSRIPLVFLLPFVL